LVTVIADRFADLARRADPGASLLLLNIPPRRHRLVLLLTRRLLFLLLLTAGVATDGGRDVLGAPLCRFLLLAKKAIPRCGHSAVRG
jgi:hypothetical protein